MLDGHPAAAVEVDGRPRDVGRPLRDEEGEEIGELRGVGHAPQRHAQLGQLRVVRLEVALGAPGDLRAPHEPDANGVDADVVPGILVGERLGQVEAGRARHRGRQRAGRRRLAPHRGDVHDAPAPALLHVGDDEAGHAHRAHDLELPIRLPVLVGDLLEAGRGRGARVVEEDVHAAPLGDHRVDQPLAICSAADVGDLGQHLAPRGLADLVRGLIQDFLAAGADGYPGALRGELLSSGATEPLASAGDDGDLPVQTELEHDRILLAGLSIGAGAPGPHPITSRDRSGAGTAGRFTLLYIRHTRRSHPCGMLFHDGTAAVARTQAVRSMTMPRTIRRRLFLTLTLICVMTIGVGGYLYARALGARQVYRTAPATRGALSSAVSATGTLNAVITVQVGSQVSGQIKELLVDFNSQVTKNQVIARINPDLFEAQVNQAQAQLDGARAMVLNQQAVIEKTRADLENARAALASAHAQTLKSQVAVVDGKRNFGRQHDLRKRDLIAQADEDAAQVQYDSAVAQYDSSAAQERSAGAALKSAEGQLKVADTMLANLTAQVAQN